jgi:UDP-N-acetyl-D-galactosamine dehydrogenase
MANPQEFKEEYNLDLTKKPEGKYQAVILAVCHQQFEYLDQQYFDKLSDGKLVFIDIKGLLRNQNLKNLTYWSL